jgi:iron-sulfur cluster repair protein YtfE (RIC family)
MLSSKSNFTKLSIEKMCDDIVSLYHAPIMAACKSVSAYLQSNTVIKDFSLENTELLQLLHRKLEDELSHLFLKEAGIIFPSVKSKLTQKSTTLLAPSVLDLVKHTHQLILQLLQKERQILNNYVTCYHWDPAWTRVVNELFSLETMVQHFVQVEQSKLYPLLITKVTGETISTLALPDIQLGDPLLMTMNSFQHSSDGPIIDS